MDRDYRTEFPFRNVPLIVIATIIVTLSAIFVFIGFFMWLLFGLAGLRLALIVAAIVAAPTGFVVLAAFFSKAPEAAGNLVFIGLFMLVTLSIATVKLQEVREGARRAACMNSLRKISLQAMTMEHPSPMTNIDLQMVFNQNDQDDFVEGPPFQGDFPPVPEFDFDLLNTNRTTTSVGEDGFFAFPEFFQGEQEPLKIEVIDQGRTRFSYDQ